MPRPGAGGTVVAQHPFGVRVRPAARAHHHREPRPLQLGRVRVPAAARVLHQHPAVGQRLREHIYLGVGQPGAAGPGVPVPGPVGHAAPAEAERERGHGNHRSRGHASPRRRGHAGPVVVLRHGTAQEPVKGQRRPSPAPAPAPTAPASAAATSPPVRQVGGAALRQHGPADHGHGQLHQLVVAHVQQRWLVIRRHSAAAAAASVHRPHGLRRSVIIPYRTIIPEHVGVETENGRLWIGIGKRDV